MDDADLAGEQEDLYRRAKRDSAEPCLMLDLARAVPGISVRLASGLPTMSELLWLNRAEGRAEIRLRRGMRRRVLQWFCAHELAEFALQGRRHPVQDDRAEVLADRLAAELIAPRPAFLRALQEHGADLELLGATFGASQRCMALRLGEVTGRPVAVLGELYVPRRGGLLPPDRVLRRVVERARAEAKRRVPWEGGWLDLVPITDRAREGVAVVGEE